MGYIGSYRVLLVDSDEDSAARMLKLLSLHPAAGHLIVEGLSDVSLLAGRLAREPFVDLLLLVIDPDGNGGFTGESAVVDNVSGSSTQVVYFSRDITLCTAVYRTEHVCFLPLPCNAEDFEFAIDKALANLSSSPRARLVVRNNGTIRGVAVPDIELVECRSRKVVVRLVTGEEFETCASLTEVERELGPMFAKARKGCLANLSHVTELNAGSLLMTSGEAVTVSQRQRRTVREAYLAYLKSCA